MLLKFLAHANEIRASIDCSAVYLVVLSNDCYSYFFALHTLFGLLHWQLPPPPHELQSGLLVKLPQLHWATDSVGCGVWGTVGGEVGSFVGLVVGEEVGKAVMKHVHCAGPVGLLVG